MSVEIDPVELGFRRPFTVEVSRLLKIRNPNTTPVAFKVKTTAPKQYCVRPNSGRIEPDREVEVTVLLQAMKSDPPLDAKCRDKFLVQSCPITSDKEFASVQDIWDTTEKANIQEKKIRVVFQPAEGSDHIGPAATPMRNSLSNGMEATPEPQRYASPSEADTATTYTADTAETSPPAYSPAQRGAESEDKKPLAAPPPAVSNAASAAAAAAVSAKDVAEKTIKALPAKVDAAKGTAISAADSSGLRQRKSASTTTASPAQVHPAVQGSRQGTEGVPVHIVALLCLISFLLAYFFF